MSKGLPKRRIKKNFVKDKLLTEDKMAKLSKGDKIRYAKERELFQQQIDTLSKASLKKIEELNDRLKVLKEKKEKTDEDIEEEEGLL